MGYINYFIYGFSGFTILLWVIYREKYYMDKLAEEKRQDKQKQKEDEQKRQFEDFKRELRNDINKSFQEILKKLNYPKSPKRKNKSRH